VNVPLVLNRVAPELIDSCVVILLEAEDALDVPAAFVALTVNVYAVFWDSPDTVMVPDPAWLRVPVSPPGDEVAV
jgi:hypothetical protein